SIALDSVRVPLRDEAQFVHQPTLGSPAQAPHSCTRDTVAAIVEGAVFHKHNLRAALLPEDVADELGDLEGRVLVVRSHVIDLARHALLDQKGNSSGKVPSVQEMTPMRPVPVDRQLAAQGQAQAELGDDLLRILPD